jgi:hypothetical protein
MICAICTRPGHVAASCPKRRRAQFVQIVRFVTVGATIVTLAGCAQDPPAQPIKLQPDNHCRLDSDIGWSVDDTQETIDRIRRHDAGYLANCPDKAAPKTTKQRATS